MNIAVIAANGRLGRVFVEEALKAGHSVRAGVRHAGSLTPAANLEVLICDATKPEDLSNLIANQDVVVSAIGHVKSSTPDVQTVATSNLISVMNELGMTRYVDVTGTGVRFAGDKITLIDRVLNLGVQIVDPSRVKDGRDHQELLKGSGLDWTTIRILKLQDVSPRPFELTLHGPTKIYVGRRDVAAAMLQVIEQHSFIRQAPILSRPSHD
ncbi:MAG: NAD(P)H-binding protein [Patescibacteria group bacterium]